MDGNFCGMAAGVFFGFLVVSWTTMNLHDSVKSLERKINQNYAALQNELQISREDMLRVLRKIK